MVRTRIRVQFTVLTLAAGVLAPAPAAPQAPAAAEREAFAALGRAVEAVERAPDGDALWRAAGQAVAAAEQAANAFAETDRARDAALAAYRAAYREALAGAVTCTNGYPCTNGRVDPFDGFAAAFAAHFELIAAVSAANAAHVDAAGIPGADAARARAARIRGLAARMRDLDAIDDPRRWNALVASVGAEIAAGNALHRRANEARYAADRARVDDVTRVMDALYLAANRIRQPNRGAAALRDALDSAWGAIESQRSRILEAATSAPDVVPTRRADTGGTGGGDPRRAVAATADAAVTEPVPDAPRAVVAASEPEPADDVAPRADTAAADPEPADDIASWGRTLIAAARAAEQAAADAETAAGASGSSRARASSCGDAEARVTAAAARATSLTVGDDRPRYVPTRTGRETYSDLFHLLDAAQRRARAACRSIGR